VAITAHSLQHTGPSPSSLNWCRKVLSASECDAPLAGLGGFFSPVSAGTKLAEGKETREIGGRLHVFERPLKGDVALMKARAADRWGNLVYSKSARNFNPVMAAAAELTVVEVDTMVELGEMDPEAVVTPSIFVDRVVVVEGAWSS
jgi:3-oxoadipate CoA-transferase, alpha subunit